MSCEPRENHEEFHGEYPIFPIKYIQPALVLCPRLFWDDCREPYFSLFLGDPYSVDSTLWPSTMLRWLNLMVVKRLRVIVDPPRGIG